MDTLFTTNIITKSISIEPKYINNNLDNYLLSKLKKKYEEKCISNGFIKKNSIKIIKRSMGEITESHFNGNIVYRIKFSIDLCNPLEGNIIEAQVTNVNKMGIIAIIANYEKSPLNILLARQHHMDNDEFTKLSEGDLIEIKIIGKRFEYGDDQISIIAVLNT